MKKLFFLFIILIFLSGHAAADESPEFVTDRVIVVTKPAPAFLLYSYTEKFGNVEILDVSPLYNESRMRVMSQEPETLVLILKNSGRENVLNAISELSKLPNIEYAQPDYIYKMMSAPNDPYFGSQYGLTKISAPSVWDMNIDCSNIIVGILDSGIDYNHEDLVGNLWVNTGEIPNNKQDDDGNGYIDDVYGWNVLTKNGNIMDDYVFSAPYDVINYHGTHVSGIIGAVRNNSKGISGAANNAKLCGVKVFDKNGSGATTSVIANGIKYLSNIGAKVINCSFGDSVSDNILKNAMIAADDCLFVCAAGNDNKNNDLSFTYPASYVLPNLISVINSTASDERYSNSSYGKTMHIAAPGEGIYSTLRYNAYGYKTGTSMSAPYVSGAAAVIRAENSELSPMQVRNRLVENGDYVPALLPYTATGKRLNMLNSLNPLEVSEILDITEDGYFASVKLNIDMSEKVTLSVAFYDNERRLISVHTEKRKTANLVTVSMPDNVKYIKAFIFSDTDGLKPLCEHIEIGVRS